MQGAQLAFPQGTFFPFGRRPTGEQSRQSILLLDSVSEKVFGRHNTIDMSAHIIYLLAGDQTYEDTSKPLFHGHNHLFEAKVQTPRCNLAESLFSEAFHDTKKKSFDVKTSPGRPYRTTEVVTSFRDYGPPIIHKRATEYQLDGRYTTPIQWASPQMIEKANRQYLKELHRWVLFLQLMYDLETAFQQPCRILAERLR